MYSVATIYERRRRLQHFSMIQHEHMHTASRSLMLPNGKCFECDRRRQPWNTTKQ